MATPVAGACVVYKGDRILSHRANGIDLVDRLPGTQLTLVDGGHMLPITQSRRRQTSLPTLHNVFIETGSRNLPRLDHLRQALAPQSRKKSGSRFLLPGVTA